LRYTLGEEFPHRKDAGMTRVKVIVNPLAGRGHAAHVAPQIERELEKLGLAFDLVRTQCAGEAVDLARQAADDGYDVVMAVGGDGTTHEVVNGLLGDGVLGHETCLACMPAGSGNDFALMNGAVADVAAGCRQLLDGHERPVDVGRLTVDGHVTRYFDNVVGIGFDALVARATRNVKHLRGAALYVPVVLKTTFLTMRPPWVRIVYDDHVVETRSLMIVVANGPREGGAFLVAPQAKTDDGWLDVIIADDVPRLKVLRMIPHFIKGTHLSQDCVRAAVAKRVQITSEDPLYIHVDGEIICDAAHEVEVEIIPAAIRMLAASNGAEHLTP